MGGYLYAHAFLHLRHAAAYGLPSVDRDQAFETDSHVADRRMGGLAVRATENRDAGRQQRGGDRFSRVGL